MTRLSGDQKQVRLQRSAEDERQCVQSALSHDRDISSCVVDGSDDVQLPSTQLSVDNVQSVEKDLADAKAVSSDNDEHTISPVIGLYCSLTLSVPLIMLK